MSTDPTPTDRIADALFDATESAALASHRPDHARIMLDANARYVFAAAIETIPEVRAGFAVAAVVQTTSQFLEVLKSDPTLVEQMKLAADFPALRRALAITQAIDTAEPVISKHLDELRMDTDADNALLDNIRAIWNPVRAAVGGAR